MITEQFSLYLCFHLERCWFLRPDKVVVLSFVSFHIKCDECTSKKEWAILEMLDTKYIQGCCKY